MSTDSEIYEAAIPDCCQFRTYQEHHDWLMLCWGLLSAIKEQQPMDCGMCEFATRNLENKEEIK